MINQIMFVDFKAINIFWRKCFVTKRASHLESLLFSQTIIAWTAIFEQSWDGPKLV